jgi:MYXO-CTERM domain-containing protein
VELDLSVSSGAVYAPGIDPLGDRVWRVTQEASPTPAGGNEGPFTGHPSNADPAAALDDDYTSTFATTEGSFNGPFSATLGYTARPHTATGRFSGPDNGSPLTPSITYAVTDADGQTGTVARTVTVRDNVPTIAVHAQRFVDDDAEEGTAIAEVDVIVKAETDADLLRRINVAWGDGETGVFFNCAVPDAPLPPGCHFNAPNSLPVQVTLRKPTAYTDNNGTTSWRATFTVTDEDSTHNTDQVAPGGVIAEATFAVQNTVPVIVSSNPLADPVLANGATVLVTEGQGANVIFTACDKGTQDIGATADFLFQIDWADGSTDTVTGANVAVPAGPFFAGCREGRAVHVYNTPGTFAVKLRVTDKDGGNSVVQQFTVEVSNIAPTVVDVFNTGPVVEGSLVTAVGLVDNRGADDLVYSFQFGCMPTGPVGHSDFDVTAPPGLFSPTAPTPVGYQRTSVASHTFANDGDYTVCFRVCDDDNLPNSCAFGSSEVTVLNGNPSITSFTVTQPDLAIPTVSLAAAATDPGVEDVLSYTFDCGDGSDPISGGSGSTSASSCTYANSGLYTVSLTVEDDDGGSAVASRAVFVTVPNRPPVLNGVSIAPKNEGQASVVIVDATDPDGDVLTYSYDFDNDGVFDASGPNASAGWTFREDGSYPVRVRVCDTYGACVDNSGALATAVVNNVLPTITSLNVTSSVTAGSVVVANATATDPGNDVLRYTFRFQTSAGAPVQTVGPQTDPLALVTLTEAGAYQVIVEVRDTVAGVINATPVTSAPAPFSVTDLNVLVSAFAQPNVIEEGGLTTITVSPTGTGPFKVSYDIDGNGSFEDDVDIVVQAPRACNISEPCAAEVTYANNRPGDLPYRVLVAVTDTGAGDTVATAIVSVTVRNVAPTIATLEAQSVVEGSTLTLPLTGSDPGLADNLSFQLVSAPPGVELDTSSGLSPISRSLTWTPGYEDAGENTITLRLGDGDGGFDEVSFVVTVAIVDENDNGVSDNLELALNNGELFPDNAGQTDSSGDGVSDLDKLLAGKDPFVSEAPTAPVIIRPNGETVETLTPILLVANAGSPRALPLLYTFVVEDEDGTEVGRMADVTPGQSTTSVVFDAVLLAEDATYVWFAFAHDGLADGEQSARATFRVNTENAAPPAPENLTPLDEAVFPPNSQLTLEARAVLDPDGDAVWYGFELATADTFLDSQIVVASPLRAVPFFAPGTLAAGTYHWRAYASDGALDSDYGDSTSFTIEAVVVEQPNRAPTAPGIVSPSDTTVTSASVSLTLSAATDPDGDALSYHFELADNAAFAGATTSGPQAGLTFQVSGLAEDTTHYWRARASDGELVSDWVSAVFHVNAENGAPRGLALLLPYDGAVLPERPTSFLVQNATDPEGDVLTYTFEVATDEDFEDVLLLKGVVEGESVTNWTPADDELELARGSTYYWRVTVSDGESELSASASFRLLPEDEGGCGCSASEPAGSRSGSLAGLLALGLLGLGLVRRRR